MNPSSSNLAQNAPDPVEERAERQMRVMARLTEIGMDLARTLQEQVCGGGPLTMRGDPALMFSRIARTVRQCIVLEAKIAEALREWRALSDAERAERRALVDAKASEASARDETDIEDCGDIERGSDRGLEAERGETERGERAERFWADHYVIEDESSFLDIVAKVCRDLGVTPDWSGWSEEGPGDLVVKPDPAARLWRDDGLGFGMGIGSVGRVPPQRGPPS